MTAAARAHECRDERGHLEEGRPEACFARAHVAAQDSHMNIPKMLFLLLLLLPGGCGESVRPEKVAAPGQKAFQRNAADAVGVAEGDRKVSPFGKPAH